jgi:hypothetical protein
MTLPAVRLVAVPNPATSETPPTEPGKGSLSPCPAGIIVALAEQTRSPTVPPVSLTVRLTVVAYLAIVTRPALADRGEASRDAAARLR